MIIVELGLKDLFVWERIEMHTKSNQKGKVQEGAKKLFLHISSFLLYAGAMPFLGYDSCLVTML